MTYKDLRKLFHDPSQDVEAIYANRFSSEYTLHLDMNISGHSAFLCFPPELYTLSLQAERLDKEIFKLQLALPPKAVSSYMESRLIEEIVLTNEIEGVHSTRREIGEVLERLKHNDKRGRFNGIVQKYSLLTQGIQIPLETCEDIRTLYNDILLEDIKNESPNNTPDGKLFRKKTVHVVDEAGIPIHDGVEPEEKIIDTLNKALAILDNEELPVLARVAAFHFLFGYIHPFYDGNGRINRFISSYIIANAYEPIIGVGLSHAVKSEIKKYYKAYKLCEHNLNRGDITPFAISFGQIIVQSMKETRLSLTERSEQFRPSIHKVLAIVPQESALVAEDLITATLFSPYGIKVSELCETYNVSRQTIYKRIDPLRKAGLLLLERIGRQTYYTLDLDKLQR